MSPVPVTTLTLPNTRATQGSGHHGLVHLGLSWHPADPAAVRMHVAERGRSAVRWLFARQLLADGVNAPTGDGDITVTPTLRDGVTEIVIRDPRGIGGNLALHVPTASVARFLGRTYVRTAVCDERYEFDTAALFRQEDAA